MQMLAVLKRIRNYSLLAALLICAGPLLAEDPAGDSAAVPSASTITMDWSALADELVLDHLFVVSGAGTDGGYTLLGVAGHGHSGSSYHYRVTNTLRERLRLDRLENGDDRLQAIVFWEPYSPDLVKATPGQHMGDEFPDWVRRPWQFSSFLRYHCYEKIDYERGDASEQRAKHLQCYLKFLEEYAAGDTLAYDAYLIWGVKPYDVAVDSPLVVILLVLTLLGMTLPLLAIYLGILYLFRDALRDDAFAQRLAKVLLPLAIGVASGIFWLMFRGNGWRLPGLLDLGVSWLILSSFYFALTFVVCMWIADRWVFPENGVLPLWLIIVGYLISPALIVFGGAIASGAAGAASGSSSSGRSSSGSGSGDGGPLRSGGGTFGGGGASGSF